MQINFTFVVTVGFAFCICLRREYFGAASVVAYFRICVAAMNFQVVAFGTLLFLFSQGNASHCLGGPCQEIQKLHAIVEAFVSCYKTASCLIRSHACKHMNEMPQCESTLIRCYVFLITTNLTQSKCSSLCLLFRYFSLIGIQCFSCWLLSSLFFSEKDQHTSFVGECDLFAQ